MKRALLFLGAAILVFLVWTFIQYKQIAKEAEARVEQDVRWLMTRFEQGNVDDNLQLERKTHLQTQLVVQGVDEMNRFVRGYHSLFIEDGKRTCLLSEVGYEQRQPVLMGQRWLKTEEGCLP